jgi:hypothetical protein
MCLINIMHMENFVHIILQVLCWPHFTNEISAKIFIEFKYIDYVFTWFIMLIYYLVHIDKIDNWFSQ